MANGTLSKVTARTAGEICRRAKLGDEAKALLREQATPRQFLDLLVEKEQFADACVFLAHALPKREAVWWACVCVRLASAATAPPQAAALQAAERWVATPTDLTRRAAWAAAEAADVGTPAGCTGAAVFFSGGSLAPPDLPEVPPAEHLTADAVAGAVQLAAVQPEAAKAPEKFRKFLTAGIDVANGANRWKEAPAAVKKV